MNSLAAINVFKNSELLNTNGIPIVFYWDGNSNIHESILNDESFFNWLVDHKVFSEISTYLSTEIAYFYFTIGEGDKEIYQEKRIWTQEYFTLDKVDENIAINIYMKGLNYLYNASFNDDYKNDSDFINSHELSFIVKDIYDKIQSKYGTKLTKLSFINGIRSYYQNNTDLSAINTNIIVSRITNILEDVN